MRQLIPIISLQTFIIPKYPRFKNAIIVRIIRGCTKKLIAYDVNNYIEILVTTRQAKA